MWKGGREGLDVYFLFCIRGREGGGRLDRIEERGYFKGCIDIHSLYVHGCEDRAD